MSDQKPEWETSHRGPGQNLGFEATATSLESIVTVTLSGEIDASASVFLRDSIRGSVVTFSTMIIDLSEVTYLDSTGLGMFASALIQMNNKGGKLILCGPSPFILKTLRLTKLDSVMSIFETYEEALKSCQSGVTGQ